jgi:hypothetical protein
MELVSYIFPGLAALVLHGGAFILVSEEYFSTKKIVKNKSRYQDRLYSQLVERGVIQPVSITQQKPQIDPAEKLNQLERVIHNSASLPKNIKTPTKAVLKSLQTTIAHYHDELTVEQQHTVDTILFEHIPDTLKLFASVPVKEQKKHAYRVQKNLMSMTSALTAIQKSITSTNIRQLKTNNLYLEEKFKTPSLEQ